MLLRDDLTRIVITLLFLLRDDLTRIINTHLLLLQERQDLGEALLSLNYLPSAGRLNVDVIKVKQLLQTDMVGGSGECQSLYMSVWDP